MSQSTSYFMILASFTDGGGAWIFGQPHTGLCFSDESRARQEVAELKQTSSPTVNFSVVQVMRRNPEYKTHG